LVNLLQYGSLLVYTKRPDPDSKAAVGSRRFTKQKLKQDKVLSNGRTATEQVAEMLKELQPEEPLAHFFTDNDCLVPVPSSALRQKDSLWVPKNLADALLAAGFGSRAEVMLRRTVALDPSHRSGSGQRASLARHIETIGAAEVLEPPMSIILVDDVITTGATILGAASVLQHCFPDATIRGFAAVGTLSYTRTLDTMIRPTIDTVRAFQSGKTFRNPPDPEGPS